MNVCLVNKHHAEFLLLIGQYLWYFKFTVCYLTCVEGMQNYKPSKLLQKTTTSFVFLSLFVKLSVSVNEWLVDILYVSLRERNHFGGC